MDRVSRIYKVLSGEASAAELNEVTEWIRQSPENKAEFEDIKLLWASSDAVGTKDTQSFDEGLVRIKARMRSKIRRRNWVRSGVQTALIILCGLCVFLLFHDSGPGLRDVEGLRFDAVSLEEAIRVIEDEYDIEIRVEGTVLLSCRLTLILYKTTSDEEVVSLVARSLNAEVVLLAPKTYRLTGRACEAPGE